tara:strand:+ start:3132 stop:3599 length:468 start_codon:yes stop_codon:yes gene_type:complete
MAYQPRASGLGSTGAYQVAGRPYITGSVIENGDGSQAGSQLRLDFPYVTRSIQILNTGSASIKFHFVDVVANQGIIPARNYYVVPPDMTKHTSGSLDNYITGSFRNQPTVFNIKCKEVYISSAGEGQSGFQLAAELTHIPSGDMYVLTGSGIHHH